MNQHLYNQMSTIMRVRDEKGYDTNARALRLWLEWADDPRDGVAVDDDSSDNPLYDDRWFRNVPKFQDREGRRTDWSAWLSPNGMLWTFGYAGHYGWTVAAFGQSAEQDKRFNFNHGVALLERAGWLHLSAGSGWVYYPVTRKQQMTLDEMAEAGCRVSLKDSTLSRGQSGFPDQAATYDDPAYLALSKGPIHSYDWKDERWWRTGTARPEPSLAARALAEAEEARAATIANAAAPQVWDRDANAMRWTA